jgi:hypothetical protein
MKELVINKLKDGKMKDPSMLDEFKNGDFTIQLWQSDWNGFLLLVASKGKEELTWSAPTGYEFLCRLEVDGVLFIAGTQYWTGTIPTEVILRVARPRFEA